MVEKLKPKAGDRQGQTFNNTSIYETWQQLAHAEQKIYEALAKPFEDDYQKILADYNARVPLSPSLASRVSEDSAPSDSEEDWDGDGAGYYERCDKQNIRRGIQAWNRYRRDHPRAFGPVVTPIPDRPFPFFQLPICIRLQVLGRLLKREKEVRQRPEDYKDDDDLDKVPVDTRLFAVSEQMRTEAEAVFFSTNTFRVDVDNAEYPKLPIFMRSEQTMPRNLKRLHIWIFYVKKGDGSWHWPKVEAHMQFVEAL